MPKTQTPIPMEEKGLREELHKIIKDVIKFYELKWELFKLELVESLAQLYTRVFSLFMLLVIVPILALFLLIALAIYLGKIWGELYLGFLAVSGIIFVLGVILFLFRRALITNPLVDALISAMFENQNQKEIKRKQNATTSANKKSKGPKTT